MEINMQNKFIDIISSPMLQTNNVYRYSGTKMMEQENLTTHIYETQMIGYILINYMNQKCGENLNVGTYLEKALHHDLEESMTGDIVRTLKYHNSSVLRELQAVAKEVAEELYQKYFSDEDQTLLKIWEDAKQGKEGFILKIVDMLTVVNRVIKEVEYLHNIHFLRVAYEVNIYLTDISKTLQNNPVGYTQASVEYLASILEDAQSVLSDILYEHQQIARKYNITEKSLLKEYR